MANQVLGEALVRDVHRALAAQFGTEQWINLAEVSDVLKLANIDYKELGFLKLGEFLTSLIGCAPNALEMRRVEVVGGTVVEVLVHQMPAWGGPSAILGVPEKNVPTGPVDYKVLAKSIHRAIANQFGTDEWAKLSDALLALKAIGVDYKALGFLKLGDFLETVAGQGDGYLELRRISAGTGTNMEIVAHAEPVAASAPIAPAAPAAPSTLAPAFDYEGVARTAASTEEYASARPAPDVLASLSSDFFENSKLSYKIKGFIIPHAPQGTDIDAMVGSAWSAALAVGAIRTYDGKLIFPLPIMREDGDRPIELNLAPNTLYSDDAPWFVSYVDTSVQPRRPRPVIPGKALEEFAYLGYWETFLEELASLALPESWDFCDATAPASTYVTAAEQRRYPILKSYITNIFFRLKHENKICIADDNSFAAFNSGLVDRRYDDIYVCFEPNVASSRSQWRFAGFCVQGVGRLGKRLVNLFNPLPQTATFFDRKEDLLFDLDADLVINYDHVLLDNIARLPVEFIKEGLRLDDIALKMLDQIAFADDEQRRDIYEQISERLENDYPSFRYLRGRLDDAVKLARKRVRWNYKTAIPMYYPRANTMSLLLPLCLMDDARADAALVVELMDSGNYQGQTILTMRMAYQDARLVCRPDSDWLTTLARSEREDVE